MRKKIIISSIVTILLIIVFVIINSPSNKDEYVTVDATLGTVQQTVDATGSIESSNAIELNFKTTGRLSSINVEVGDNVTTGQTIATLEAGALQSRVTNARSSLLEAQANLEKVISGATSEDLYISELTVKQKKQELDAAIDNLNNLKLQRDTELNNLKNTAILKLNNELVVAQAALEIVDNTLKNEDAQETLGILESNSVALAIDDKDIASNQVEQVKIDIININNSSPDTDVLLGLNQVKQALSTTRDALTSTFNVLENTISSGKLSQSELDALISGIQSEQTKISTSRTNLQTAESNWTNKKIYYADQITKAQNKISSSQDNLALAKAQLSLKNADPKDYEITSAQAKVAKAQANLSLALANLNDTIIRAPVNGTITEINNEIGEQTSFASPVIKMIGESKLEIEVDIPESDIAKIEVGQQAEITLDSFGDEQIFNGTVTFVNPAETVIQDVVYYQVKVQFSDNQEKIKPGMTANVIIKTRSISNVLRVPLRAVRTNNGDKIIQILVNKEKQEKKVTTGLRGDDYIEILEGINEGDQIITFIKEKK